MYGEALVLLVQVRERSGAVSAGQRENLDQSVKARGESGPVGVGKGVISAP